MSDRLAVIVPTRGRPDNIRAVLDAWDFTRAWDVADLILAVDRDDPEFPAYRKIHAENAHRISIWTKQDWVPMVPKLNECALDVANEEAHFAIGFAGDDHVPRTINWAKKYLQVLRELGTGMVYGDDGYQGGKLSTEWAVTADAVRALGRMVPAPVEHLYCDNAMMDVYGGAGAMRHLPEIRIEHMHPITGRAASDEQYERVNSGAQYAKDRLSYNRWKTTALPTDIKIIEALRPGAPRVQPTAYNKSSRGSGSMRGSGPQKIGSRGAKNVQRSGPSARNVPPKSKFPFPPAFREVIGATPDEIGFTLADFAKVVPSDQEIVEIGVFQARTALIMAWGASQGNGAHVTAIDPWELTGNVYDPPFTLEGTRKQAEYNVQSVGYSDRVTLVQAFSHTVAEAGNFAGSARRVGLLFVDGDHTKEGARRDIEAWSPHLADGAIIAIDDYGHVDWPGVGEAVDELVDEGFLEPITVYHDRLAVTRLGGRVNEPGKLTAITSEGVEPGPQIYADAQTSVTMTDVSRETSLPTEAELKRLPIEELRKLAASPPYSIPRAGVTGREKLITILREHAA